MKPEPRLIAQIMYRKRKAIGSRLVNQLSCSHVKGWKHVVSRLNRAGLTDVSETRARAQKKTRHSGSRRETLRRVSVLEHQSARNITNHLTDGFFSIFSGECNISAPPATLLMSRQWPRRLRYASQETQINCPSRESLVAAFVLDSTSNSCAHSQSP